MSTLEVNFIHVLTLGPLLFPGARSTWRRSAVKSQRRFRRSFATGKNITRQTRWRDHWNRPLCSSAVCAQVSSYLLREPVRRSPRFCKWFDGSTDRYPVETKMIRNEMRFIIGLLYSSAFSLPSLISSVYFIHIFGHHLGVNSGKIYAEIKPASTVRSSKRACQSYIPPYG